VSEGALEGIRVIDATQMLAGPMAGTRLGDLGADVIKVEPPASGEFNRTHGFGDARANGEMTTFLAVNRNKRSLAVDLKSDAGAQIIHDLARTSDVFIQNFRHGTADRLGVGYEQLSAINPGIVYCSISGYGSSGPYRDRPGQDLVLQGYSGSMFSVGKAGDPPIPSALWAADVMTGYQAVIGILAALVHRQKSGVGQHIEVDMLSVVLDCQLQELVTYLNAGIAPDRTEESGAHGSIPAPYGSYQTSDGWLNLAMCPLPALGEVLDNDWLRTLVNYNDGHIHRDEIYRTIRHAFLNKSTQEWIERCDEFGVWAGPVYDFPALVQDRHVVAEQYIVEQPQRIGGSAKTLRPPLKMSATPPRIRNGAPALGADSVAVLRDLGYGADRVRSLVTEGVIAALDEGKDDNE
jgi:crotonobetainyl-CoA:carnitine CoA-transferase CaiB-like acyl-CoA transferase